MESLEIGDKSKDFHRFLTEICEEFKEKCDTDNATPIRHPNPRITPPELEGECLEWCLNYLSTRGCPVGFGALIAREVYKAVLDEDLKAFYTEDTWIRSPRIEGEAGDNDVDEEYDAEKLQKHVLGLLEGVCNGWLQAFPEFQVDGKHPTLSYHAVKNTRRKMEDRHLIIPDLNALFGITDQPPQAFYGVFDGHAGTDAAIFTAKHMPGNLVHHCGLDKTPGQACKLAFKVTDEMYIPKAKKERWRSGTTGVTALVRGDKIYLSWLGDSQAVLVKNGKVVTEMEPHKPDRQDERDRIKSVGGFVMQMGDLWRVGGNLAVSRAIGDVQYKPSVCSDAEVLEVQLDGTEEYMVLACDGLWDAVTNEELPRLVYKYIQNGGQASGVSKFLVHYAKDHDSQDNISVITLFFRENLSEPVADAGFFNFLNSAGGEGDNSGGNNNDTQGSYNQSGENNQESGKGGKGGDSGGDSNAPGQGAGNSAGGGENDQNDGRTESCDNENERGLRQASYKPEMLININHMSFELCPSVGGQESDAETGDEAESPIQKGGKRFSEPAPVQRFSNPDLDYYGVFNTRLVDGPIDLSLVDDSNSSALLKNIADDVYNTNEFDTNALQSISSRYIKKSTDRSGFESDRDREADIENSLHNYLMSEGVTKKKVKKSKLDTQRSKNSRKARRNSSPVCWAFTGKNKASVQNHKLNMAAKSLYYKGSNEPVPTVKAPPSKFAQVYSSNDTVHEIATMTLNPGKLESLPQPRPKVLPTNLANLSCFKVYGSLSGLEKEPQKFHTTWRPRKPLKPISSIVYETPPTPFVNSKMPSHRNQ